ncbi:YcgN family cysteine cluster protein [Bowmanella sp. Y26]|uniref:YcgN family cysteine cluster protein n=1 Tax=Bowmanella yangjiangensis TaxID=2811230 RepID=UPI001BDCD9C9|nr:YcgN family cysteine cluster protein [Bowmanella yangjiangensis]MBT1065313.1 YcgN family cysteine cluster protein [Bowmanella yangjiangensis]
MLTPNFWQQKSLEDMTDKEWEAICDGCAKCCLHKIIDDDEGDGGSTDVLRPGEQLHYTRVACHLLNTKSCECTQYAKRSELVPDCVKLTKDNLQDIFFMPPSCSYRRLYEGRGLPSWHPLLNKGKKTAMHKAGMSVRGKTISDDGMSVDELEDYIAIWPLADLD